MKLDYDKLVKDIDIKGLTLRKVTNKFIKENFEIDILKKAFTLGDGDIINNSETSSVSGEAFVPEIVDVAVVPFTELLMSQEMPTVFWLGFMQNMIKGDFVKTVRDQHGRVLIQSYNKTSAPEVSSASPALTEEDLINGLKSALKTRIKQS